MGDGGGDDARRLRGKHGHVTESPAPLGSCKQAPGWGQSRVCAGPRRAGGGAPRRARPAPFPDSDLKLATIRSAVGWRQALRERPNR